MSIQCKTVSTLLSAYLFFTKNYDVL